MNPKRSAAAQNRFIKNITGEQIVIAKILITIPLLMFTVLPPLVDFGESHVLHPDWTKHARFHTAWLVLENSLVGVLALALTWYQGTHTKLLIAGGISTLVLGGFMLATLFMPLYSGALSDPGPGEAPHESKGIDLNLAVFGAGFLLSLAGLILAYLSIWNNQANTHIKGENQMKLNVMFTIATVVMILFAILSFFAPPALRGTDPSAAFSAKIVGVILLSLGVMAWLVRNAEPSKTRDSVVLGYTLLFALWAAVSLYGVFLVDMPTHSISWGPALIQALLAIGFFVSGRAGMSTRLAKSAS